MLTTKATYRIVVQGRLGPDWAAYFGGLTLSWQEPDQTVLLAQVIDQAALHGLLNAIGDLGPAPGRSAAPQAALMQAAFV
jgi:hypothetical protein